MPVTRSEMMFFAAGTAAGGGRRCELAASEREIRPDTCGRDGGRELGPGRSYADLAKNVAEKVEAVQDAMAEMKESQPAMKRPRLPRSGRHLRPYGFAATMNVPRGLQRWLITKIPPRKKPAST